jgi:hypothetical protein
MNIPAVMHARSKTNFMLNRGMIFHAMEFAFTNCACLSNLTEYEYPFHGIIEAIEGFLHASNEVPLVNFTKEF